MKQEEEEQEESINQSINHFILNQQE